MWRASGENVTLPDRHPVTCQKHVLRNKVIWETGNVGLHWPGSCRCTPSRPAASRCNCIPCPDSWCCCSLVGSASSRSSANGTTERCTQHIHTSLCSEALTASLVFAPTPGQRQRVCRQAAVVHRFISVWARTERGAAFLQSMRSGNTAVTAAAAPLWSG